MKNLKQLLLLFYVLLFCWHAELNAEKKELTFSVLQLNLWHEGTKVPDGYQAIVNVLHEVNADIVFLCEIKNTGATGFMPTIIQDLKEKGQHYYGETLGLSVGILSKFEIDSISKCCIVPGNEKRAMLKADITIAGQQISFYSCHLDYLHYECYMPRGYSGTTWKKIEQPVTDETEVLQANRLSFRDESIKAFINNVQSDIQSGKSVILGGDFNEPSHLDWQANTKDLWDHNGAVINWDCSVMLHKAGFIDSYRAKYPDPVHYPGFTFPAGNRTAEKAGLEKLAWAPDADERDRIDFIYYYPANSFVKLEKSLLVGPLETVIRGKIEKNDSKDHILKTRSIWPSDHKGNIAVFKILQ